MLGESINNIYTDFTKKNKNHISRKMNYLEDFREREEVLRDYKLELSHLDKMQAEAGFFRLEAEYENMLFNLKNFNPYDVQNEIQKVEHYKVLISTYKDDIHKISQKVRQINKLWKNFISRNENIKGTQFEDLFMKEYNNVQKEINSTSLSRITGLIFLLEKLEQNAITLISTIDSLNLYINEYIFLGDEAEKLKSKILNSIEFHSKEHDLPYFMSLVSEIEEMESKSLAGTIGFEVLNAVNKKIEGINKHTIKVSDLILKYEPFFNNDDIEYIEIGEFLYFDNYPYKGIFKGRDIVDKIRISNSHIKSILDYKEKIVNFTDMSIIIMFILSFIIYLTGSMYFLSLFSFFTVLYFLNFKFFLNRFKDIIEAKHKTLSFFIFKKINLHIMSIGIETPVEEIHRELIFNFNKTIEKQQKEGESLWIKKYLFQKNQ